ncbi:type II toxin-antitoxin system prevent-host-death family antitoxin [Agromyces bauzanensis]|uniref:type II toxin-antitoxin system Phd/YefM family antitoxin n=1 Tax=Agromyces bauzanensis TaxID=1308924 RepID=UPI0031E72DC0
MDPVNIHDAKTHFSRLVDMAAAGETVIIAKSGTPVAKLTRLERVETRHRIGFLQGEVSVPDDFDEIASDEIAAMFGDPA